MLFVRLMVILGLVMGTGLLAAAYLIDRLTSPDRHPQGM